MTAEARLARWTAPLVSPCADARAHPHFDAIRMETSKLESPTGGAPDWEAVLRLADVFLAEIGRDVLVAAALGAALAHREGVGGAALGARVVAAMVSDATASPSRPRARANAVALFLGRAELALDGPRERTREPLVALEAALGELDAALARLDDAPPVRPIRDRARAAADALAPAAPPPPVFALPPPPTASVAAAPTPPTAALADTLPDRADQVPAFLRRVSSQLVPAAALLRTSPLDADALRVTLVALYLPITAAPETTRDARTALTAPPKLVLETLAKQTTAPPENAARDAIAALERSRFALDVHACLARALERAGSAAVRARDVHRHELRGLIARLPELLDRQFADGTPFASAETRALFATWDERPAVVAVSDGVDPSDAVRALASEGRTADALEAGVRARRHAGAGRDRFAIAVAMAHAAERARALPLAAELLAELLADVDRHALEAWEPARAAEVLRAAARVGAALPSAPTALQTAFARLARTDARAAFEISSSTPATPGRSGR